MPVTTVKIMFLLCVCVHLGVSDTRHFLFFGLPLSLLLRSEQCVHVPDAVYHIVLV